MQQLNITTSYWLALMLVSLSKFMLGYFRLVILQQAEEHCHCVQLPKHERSQLKRACCRQIFWWGDIKQVPWMIFPTVLSEQTFSFSGQTSTTNQPRSTKDMYLTGNTEIHHSVNACTCSSASRKIMLEKIGRHCEGKEENTGKVTQREPRTVFLLKVIKVYTGSPHTSLYYLLI